LFLFVLNLGIVAYFLFFFKDWGAENRLVGEVECFLWGEILAGERGDGRKVFTGLVRRVSIRPYFIAIFVLWLAKLMSKAVPGSLNC
jgi:hypothetical protein